MKKSGKSSQERPSIDSDAIHAILMSQPRSAYEMLAHAINFAHSCITTTRQWNITLQPVTGKHPMLRFNAKQVESVVFGPSRRPNAVSGQDKYEPALREREVYCVVDKDTFNRTAGAREAVERVGRTQKAPMVSTETLLEYVVLPSDSIDEVYWNAVCSAHEKAIRDSIAARGSNKWSHDSVVIDYIRSLGIVVYAPTDRPPVSPDWLFPPDVRDPGDHEQEDVGTIAGDDEIIGPAPRRQSSRNGIVRDQEPVRRLKEMYDGECQICRKRLRTPAGWIAIAAHIQALGNPHQGPDVLENMLCLCPNDHALFDAGAILIEDDFTIVDVKGNGLLNALFAHKDHTMDQRYLAAHRKRFLGSALTEKTPAGTRIAAVPPVNN